MISSSSLVQPGPPAVHQLRTRTTRVGTLTKVTVGENHGNRPNKTIVLVGEPGGGKAALIEALVNHSMGVKFEDGVWFQVEEEERRQDSAVVVYQIFGSSSQTVPFTLTVVDTPGYGGSRGVRHDDEVSRRLLSMFQPKDEAQDLHAVGLVMKASDERVGDRLRYVFNSVVSLLGAQSAVVLITHSDGMPPHEALSALETADIQSLKDNRQETLHFLFNNRQRTPRTPQNLFGLQAAWRVAQTGLAAFTRFLTASQPKNPRATFEVLVERAGLVACVQNLQDRIRFTELKQRDVRLIMEQLKNHVEEQRTGQFTATVAEAFKDTEPIRTGPAGPVSEAAVCCPVCEENCHHPGCTMGLDPQQCEVMKAGSCTSCTNRCPASHHVKDHLRYVIRTRKVQLTEAALAQRYELDQGTGPFQLRLRASLSRQTEQLSAEKELLLERAYQLLVRLDRIGSPPLNTASTHVLLDFLIHKMKERGDKAMVQKLEEMDAKMDARTRAALLDRVRTMASDHEERISDSFLLRPGPPAVYQLRTEKEAVGTVTRVRLGRRDGEKPKKSVLLVGETGAGKSTVVDVLLNYSLGVKFEDQVWFQMTEEEPETSAVIVYQIPDGDTLPFSLSVIDTPGFGSGGGIERDAVVRERLLDLFQSQEGVQELHAVVLVTKASENRLTDRLQYVYDAVMSLLGRNMDKNTVVLVTHSDGTTPANLLQTLEAGSMKCARDGQNQPVHFLLGGNQSSRRDAAETAAALRLSWDFSYKHMDLLSRFLSSSTPQTLVSTVEVLSARVKLAACVQNLQERIQQMELKRSQISQTKEALKNQEEELKKNAKFTMEVDEVYLGQRPISGGMWGGGSSTAPPCPAVAAVGPATTPAPWPGLLKPAAS
ncbi:uncharacterized protein LOC105924174 [Fundulus heteroclitus]|uniref:uncharacterized protein LOC105924174 n=1 Tax=Fundulus heteroclitus TaxID=8078 RepID=UPI00165B558C|nr:uncharacterized protein LOC105924174 [Fundulus heteroclitus]XP_035995773.1 uncharacterized protein LOC105924174 [Fundulus heteroclitus]